MQERWLVTQLPPGERKRFNAAKKATVRLEHPECFVCGAVMQEGEGIACLALLVKVHAGACIATMEQEWRQQVSARKVRWRGQKETLLRVWALREHARLLREEPAL